MAHWLDPAYGATAPSKLAIQAKASERFAALAEGQNIAGLSLADVEDAEKALAPPPSPGGGWPATPSEVVAASAALHQALADFDPKSMGLKGGDGGLGGLVAAENHLATADCPELGSELTTAKGSAKAAVDKALQAMTGYHQNQAIAQLVVAAQADGTLGEAEAKLLKPTEQLSLLRSSTAATEKAGLSALAAEHSEQLSKLVGLKAAYSSYKTGTGLDLAGVDTPEGKAGVATFAGGAGAYFDQHTEVVGWANTVAGAQEIHAQVGYHFVGNLTHNRAELTKTFRSWAKGQKLADLREVATSMGLEVPGASRAHVQNYIASSWDPSQDKAAIAAAAKASATKKPAPVPSAKPPVPAAPSAPSPPAASAPTPKAAPPAPPSTKSFADKHLQIVEALKAHQAVAADLPARPSAAEVATWKFGPAQAAHLGGGHTKSIHAAPDGSAWMFKPDKTGGGARAHAEASASEIFSRVGVPSVAVYAREVGGKVGSIQPLVQGASSLSSDPKSWSQADVDNLVRYHVAAWAVGDHDGNASNVIRTPSGGCARSTRARRSSSTARIAWPRTTTPTPPTAASRCSTRPTPRPSPASWARGWASAQRRRCPPSRPSSACPTPSTGPSWRQWRPRGSSTASTGWAPCARLPRSAWERSRSPTPRSARSSYARRSGARTRCAPPSASSSPGSASAPVPS